MKFRTKQPIFSVPGCVFEDDLQDKALLLLIFLFQESDMAGLSSPGYEAMMRAINTKHRQTVSKSITSLREHGWFHHIKRRGHKPSIFFLAIPSKFAKEAYWNPRAKIALFKA